MAKLYDYIGPADIKHRADRSSPGRLILSADLLAWVRETGQRQGPDGLIPATFVVDEQGRLLLADRRCEHVACAGGGPVQSAGEMFFLVEGEQVEAAEVSNQSTGYCPEPESWPAVAAALERAGIAHPGRFSTEVIFRRCQKCGERNVVKEGWFVCAVCGAELSVEWNFE